MKKGFLAIGVIGIAVLLSGCGSDDSSINKTPEYKQQISVQTTGLDIGERISLQVGSVTNKFLGTAFNLPHLFDVGEKVKISVAEAPEGKACQVTQDMPFIVGEVNHLNSIDVHCAYDMLSSFVKDYNTDVGLNGVEIEVLAFID